MKEIGSFNNLKWHRQSWALLYNITEDSLKDFNSYYIRRLHNSGYKIYLYNIPALRESKELVAINSRKKLLKFVDEGNKSVLRFSPYSEKINILKLVGGSYEQ